METTNYADYTDSKAQIFLKKAICEICGSKVFSARIPLITAAVVGLMACGSQGGRDDVSTRAEEQAHFQYDWLLPTGEGPVPPGPEFDGVPAEYASAWSAKELCSRIFIAGGDPAPTQANELRSASILAPGFAIDSARITVDEQHKIVTVEHPGSPARSAQYAESQGCIIVPTFSGQFHFTPETYDWRGPDADAAWPLGENISHLNSNINQVLLDATLDAHMLLPAFGTEQVTASARAVAVLHRGELVGERYAPGYGPFTPQRAWSVSKSLTATLVGLMVDRGLLALDAPVPVAEWQGDERGRITLRHLLNMSSGLQQNRFEGGERSLETFTPENDHSFIYFDAYNTLKDVILAPAIRAPNEAFAYLNGNVLIAAALAREAAKTAGMDSQSLMHRMVFEPMGMRSSTLETDAYGNYIASGQWFTTARDMARLGWLYLNNGEYAGQRLLSQDWVDFVQTPAPTTPGYGGFWNLDPDPNCDAMPQDTYAAVGAFGQYILVVPSYELVVARLGVNFPDDYAGKCELIMGLMQAVDMGGF